MLGATAFSLVIPALAAARTAGAGPWEASLLAGAGIMAGAGAILLGRVTYEIFAAAWPQTPTAPLKPC